MKACQKKTCGEEKPLLHASVNSNEKVTKGGEGQLGGLSALAPRRIFSPSLLTPVAPRLRSLSLFLDYDNCFLIHLPVSHLSTYKGVYTLTVKWNSSLFLFFFEG